MYAQYHLAGAQGLDKRRLVRCYCSGYRSRRRLDRPASNAGVSYGSSQFPVPAESDTADSGLLGRASS